MTKKITFFLSTVFAIACFSACAHQNKWIGDLDATFKYHTTEKSTTVYEVKPGSKSSLSGLKKGDIVLSVDGEKIAGLPAMQVLASMTGPVGSNAELIVLRDSRTYKVIVERTKNKKTKSDKKKSEH